MTKCPHRSKLRPLISLLFVSSLAVCLWLGHISAAKINSRAIAQTPVEESRAESPLPTHELVQQGVERYHAGDFRGAIAPWETALGQYNASGHFENQAIVLENLARAYRSLGDADRALPYWEQATAMYDRIGNQQKAGRMLTDQAQTHTNLGHYRQAIARLCGTDAGGFTLKDAESSRVIAACAPTSALGIARSAEDSLGEAAALGSLGEAYRLQGNYNEAIAALGASRAIAQELDNAIYLAAASNGLGNVYARLAQISDRRAGDAFQRGDTFDGERLQQMASTNNEQALTYFQQSYDASRASNRLQGQLQAVLGMVPAYHRAGALSEAQDAYGQAVALLEQLPASRAKAFATIDLANLLPLTRSASATRGTLAGAACFMPDVRSEAEALLMQANATARQIGDYRAQSFALGKLGQVSECDGDYDKALAFTNEAEFAADQDLRSLDSLYLWQWQVGRILNQKDEGDKAITAYDESIATLEKIRSEILIADRDIQFDFRDAVEPVYRELAELRLMNAPVSEIVTAEEDRSMVANITSALTAIDALKLAELQNYFGDECIILSASTPTDEDAATDTRNDTTGVFSTLILNDRTAITLTLPGDQKRIEWLSVNQETLNQQINDFRLGLETSLYSLEEYDPTSARLLYDQLVRPFINDLEQAGIETLVFVQDGIFRSVPMAALHDGERYLIERYAIATTPSLSLTTLDPPPRRRNLRALALGLSERASIEGEDFRALSGVRQELINIKQQLPGSLSLLNADFTSDRLRQALQENDYSIIHMATHGKFGAEPADTFLVTGDAQKLTIGELEAAIRQSGGSNQVDLLALTACETAIGDNRSNLGLAGVAVQAGVHSAIASLWSINDASTAQIMDEFYQALNNPDLTKAQVLQTAQLSFIREGGRIARPGFWAPFVLIGDWR